MDGGAGDDTYFVADFRIQVFQQDNLLVDADSIL
jgi:hypothetical protein